METTTAPCPLKFQRFRYPRVFYGPEKLVKVYNEVEANAYDTFKALKKKNILAKKDENNETNYFMSAYQMHDKRIIAITTLNVFIFHQNEKDQSKRRDSAVTYNIYTITIVAVGNGSRQINLHKLGPNGNT